MSNQLSSFSLHLQNWYGQNQRILPWRETNDAYKIWISEIILQQTRVNQGLDYYRRFLDRFPDVGTLAIAEEDEVLKYWQGLGYYSRARNILKAAKQIAYDFDGIFPTKHNDLLKLTGIGEYTAAAISSFAYNQPYAVVDGNVYRVLSRLFGEKTPIDSSKGKKLFNELAQELLDKKNPATHNQAIMEFGALQCVPVSPTCETCIFTSNCIAFSTNLVDQLPIKEKKTKVVNRFFNYLVITNNTNEILLHKRTDKDIWHGLFDFPLIENDKLLLLNELLGNNEFKSLFENIETVEIASISSPYKHVLSHQILSVQFINIRVSDFSDAMTKHFFTVQKENSNAYAVPRLIELYINSNWGDINS